MEGKISKRLIDAVQPTDKELLVFDTALKGFVLKITPSGTRTYLVRYRMGGRDTPLKKLTIGKHGSPWTADQARKEAERILAMVRTGIDPVAAKKARDARGVTMDSLCDRFLSEHVEVHLKPKTVKEYRRLIDVVVRPKLGRRVAAEIERGDISTIHHNLRETPRQANLVLSVLSKIFNCAEAWGLRPDGSNPCRLVKRFKENSRERFLADEEIVDLGRVLAMLDDCRQESDQVLHAIRLLLLTGCRLSELLALRWEDVDVERSLLEIRAPKNGVARQHAIGSQTIALIAEVPRVSDWVLPGIKDQSKPLNIYTVEHAWRRIREASGLPDVRLHDFRHTVGTFAGQTGANAFLVRDSLGHKTTAMTNRYVNKDHDPVQELANKVGSRITGALDAGAAAAKGEATDNVVALPAGKGRKRSG